MKHRLAILIAASRLSIWNRDRLAFVDALNTARTAAADVINSARGVWQEIVHEPVLSLLRQAVEPGGRDRLGRDFER